MYLADPTLLTRLYAFRYARVSAKDQLLDTQLEQLKAAGIDRLFQEKISGTTIQRPVLTELLAPYVLETR